MPDILAPALAVPGLGWLAAVALLAGIVRGFSGFGTAMVYMPVAGQMLSPVAALVSLVIMDAIGPLAHVPRALRQVERGDLLRLCAGLAVALPAGLWVLTRLPAEAFRYGVSLISLLLLVLLVRGWRYHGRLTRGLVVGTGMLGGALGGATGLTGPPVIMLYMSASLPARVVRATLMLYLIAADALMVGVLGATGRLTPVALGVGVLMLVPYIAGNLLGGWLFRPEREALYRWVAYGIIAVSAIMGLPLLD